MAEKKENTGKRRPWKRPEIISYAFASSLARLYSKLRMRIKVQGDKPVGPALLLANHNMMNDWLFMPSICGRHRVTFMAGHRFFVKKPLGPILRLLRVIPKYQFATDITSMRRVKDVAGRGGLIYVAPEGTVYAAGRLGFISDATAKFVRFLKIPVYAVRIEGASLGCAKWSTHMHKSQVTLTTTKILTAEEAKTLDKNEVMHRIIEALSYDEAEYALREHIHVKGRDLAEGFERMFYKCPVCGREFTMSSKGCEVFCAACGSVAKLGSDFRFTWTVGDKAGELDCQMSDPDRCARGATASGTGGNPKDTSTEESAALSENTSGTEAAGSKALRENTSSAKAAEAAGQAREKRDSEYFNKHFASFVDWYDYQFSAMKREVLDKNFCMTDEVDYATDERGSSDFRVVGSGRMMLSHAGWDYTGTMRGEPYHDHDDLSAVFLATLAAGKFFELPVKNDRCRVFYPKNGNRAMKWHLASRAISELLEKGELEDSVASKDSGAEDSGETQA